MAQQSFKEGDIIYIHTDKDGKFYPRKILKIDHWPDDSVVWHNLLYEPLDHKPTPKDIKQLSVQVWHSPVKSYEDQAHFLAHAEVSKDELRGFFEYLKLIDFKRYIKETGQDLNKLVIQANEHYNRGNKFAEEKKYSDAINEYSEAVDIFPLLYEAIDNRGCMKMDLEDYEGASADFDESLRVEPNNVFAQRCLGECYLKLGSYAQAEIELQKAVAMKKDDKFAQELLGLAKALNK